MGPTSRIPPQSPRPRSLMCRAGILRLEPSPPVSSPTERGPIRSQRSVSAGWLVAAMPRSEGRLNVLYLAMARRATGPKTRP
jgi:hypothetical protein